MIIDTPGKITDRIYLLGRRESTVYLLKGDGEYWLIGGGMVHIVSDVLDQIGHANIQEEAIRRIFVLHSHFDHCGIVPFFKRRWPWVRISASERAKNLLSTPKVVGAIEALNRKMLTRYGRQKEAERLDLEFDGIAVDAVVKDGDRLGCGGLQIEVLEVPGHSACSIALYVPGEKALFGSDAGGIPFGEEIFTAANSDFDRYVESLKRMDRLAVDVYLAEHYGARTGDEARRYLKASLDSALKTRQMMQDAYARYRDEGKSAEAVTDELMARAPSDFLPREIVLLVVGQMMHNLVKQKPG